MFRSIVVGTDGSQTAERAVDHAIELARSTGSTLHIVSAFADAALTTAAAAGSPIAAGLAETYARLTPYLQEAAETIVSEAADRARGVQIRTHAPVGDPAESLIQVAEDADADVIVVGDRGMSGMRRFLLGSVANRVSHHASCHVLIVHTA